MKPSPDDRTESGTVNDKTSHDTADTLGSHPGDDQDLSQVWSQSYEIQGEVGHGGMGRVVRARDRRLGRVVALKFLRNPSPDLLARFEREVAITARLQHPAIVPVYEAGRLSSGEIFYAMPLVSGRPLSDAIAAAPTMNERTTLLPRLLAVADALAYAHEHHILHRDLKPQNIILGQFGETVVIDWGLAKDLSLSDSEPSAPRRETSGGMTQSGAVLGTPHYMAPEQARGEPVDQRADVYALGALLYHLIAGNKPHADVTATTLVVGGAQPLPPLTTFAPEVPVDLLAIVEKAMAIEANARYRNAGELAADLRRYLNGQLVRAHRYSRRQRLARWLRNHRSAARVGASLLVLLAVVTVVSVRRIWFERAQAERQRQLAAQRGVAAEGMVDFLVAKLYRKLYDLGRLDLFEGIGDAVTKYYALAPPDNDSASSARGRAQALFLLGEAAHKRGQQSEAVRFLNGSLEIWQRLMHAEPDNPEWLLGAAKTLHNLSLSHQLLGEVDAALSDSQRAVQVLSSPAAARTRSVESAHQLVTAWQQEGQVHQQRGNTEEATKACLAAQTAAENALRDHRGDPRLLDDLAVSNVMVGEGAQDRGELDEAARLYHLADEALESLLVKRPDSRDYQNSLLLTLQLLVGVTTERGQFAESLALGLRGQRVAERLAALDRSSGEQEDVLFSLRQIVADAEHALGRDRDAFAHYQALVDDAERLAHKHPDNARFMDGLATYLFHQGGALLESGHQAAARRPLERAVAVFEELLSKDGDHVEWQEGGWDAQSRLAQLELAEGHPAAAAPHLVRAQTLLAQLITKEPDKPEYRSSMSLVQMLLGLATQDAAAFAESLRLGEALLAQDPKADRLLWQRRVAETAYHIPDARPILMRQLAVLERLRAEQRLDAATLALLPVWKK